MLYHYYLTLLDHWAAMQLMYHRWNNQYRSAV
jgi:hypothetical protein